MSANYEIHATNYITAIKITSKYTLSAALIFAADLMNDWDDLYIREYQEAPTSDEQPSLLPGETLTDIRSFKIVARISAKGLLF